jgi:flagellar biosynthetic protein FliR
VIDVSVDFLQSWVASMFLPLTRMLGFIAVAPLFSGTTVSLSVKVSVGVLLTLMVAPLVNVDETLDLFSFHGIILIGQQLLIGLALGFVLRILFSAVDLAGQLSGLTMGFGFATFFDPQSGGSSTVITTLFTMLFSLVFISLDGHVLMVAALIESFAVLPINLGIGTLTGMDIARSGALIFSVGVQLAMPIVATLLITNMALGVLTRSAPQLNIFGIGFPITIGVGLLLILLILPSYAQPFRLLIENALSLMQQVGRTPP